MKDGGKNISERATRFLPVDMKDRLKSAFNRNSNGSTASEPSREDAPDYTAIFNANSTAPVQANPRLGSSSAAQLRGVTKPVAEDIEEAEVVAEAEKFKPGKGQPLGILDQSSIAMPGEARAREATSGLAEDPRPGTEAGAKYHSSKNGEPVPQKSKSRFFDDFSSTESVRLKVEKRNEKRLHEMPLDAIVNSSSGAGEAPPISEPAEISVLKSEPSAAPVFALQADATETSTNSHDLAGVATEPVTSDQAHINLLQEFDSMDAKEHESGNGAAASIDSGVGVATFAIERNSKFSGQLKFAGVVTVSGQVEGELLAERIVINEGGVVNASIDGKAVVIAGTVKGDVHAHGELEILPTGSVDGSVTAPAIVVRRGGRVDGRCTIGVPRE